MEQSCEFVPKPVNWEVNDRLYFVSLMNDMTYFKGRLKLQIHNPRVRKSLMTVISTCEREYKKLEKEYEQDYGYPYYCEYSRRER